MKTIKNLALVAATLTLAACGTAPEDIRLAGLARSDDGATHDQTHGRGRGTDDGVTHDQGDDRRGRGTDDSVAHDQGDDHGRRGGAESSATPKRGGRTARIVTPADQSVAIGGTFSLELERTRAGDDDIYVFSAEGLPAGLAIDATTGTISGTVTGDAGIYAVTVSFREANEAPQHRLRSVSFNLTVTN